MIVWTPAERALCVMLHTQAFLDAKAISSYTEIPVVQIEFWLSMATWTPKRRGVTTVAHRQEFQDWEGYTAHTLRTRFLKLAKKFPHAANPPTRPEILVWLKGLASPRCFYCLTALTPKNFVVDHRQPVSRGGTSALDNLSPTCKRCNETKGEMTVGEFTALRLLVLGWEDKGMALFRRLRGGFIPYRGGKPDAPLPTV